MEGLETVKKVKIITANRPVKLEALINQEIECFYKKGISVIDIKYAISKDIGSAIIIYMDYQLSNLKKA
ncbi:hypothetical protein [Flavivirga spongiicola]|uniref:Uncharacterized protein n=1 Tax=Flavivirga spongiicola TaxID=421621 RepID=A0ABU7XYC9_9FLAO|nr:hypothetical protein [Flavivirga sp. MEBiC05379]MDO5980782.1 hypothetical protein [Flavivirga sp. MEBiC05379]